MIFYKKYIKNTITLEKTFNNVMSLKILKILLFFTLYYLKKKIIIAIATHI